MARTIRRATISLGVLLGGVAATAGLLAGPAGAQTAGPGTSGDALATSDSVGSGGCVATGGSVCSGTGRAANDSTSSGDAVAVNGSVSSGCATAVNDSTASGAPCPPDTTVHKPVPHRDVVSRPGAPAPARTAARATPTASLARTGSSTGELAAAGALALLAGAGLVRASRKEHSATAA
jgi:LPXTG-motif cell wall-anchored protein